MQPAQGKTEALGRKAKVSGRALSIYCSGYPPPLAPSSANMPPLYLPPPPSLPTHTKNSSSRSTAQSTAFPREEHS